MSPLRETELIETLLAPLAGHPAARGLDDDAAVWTPPIGRDLVVTHDIIAEGTHFLDTDDPSDIAWKLVAVNLSDLAAKGAVPVGVLLGFCLAGAERAWLERFVAGLARVLEVFDAALFGGDTVSARATSFGCTAIGHVARGGALDRSGAQPGDRLFVTGTIGDAGLGLAIARGEAPPETSLLRRYRLPMPRLSIGQGLAAAGARAAMDVSDGLLIDARRLAAASGLAVEIDLMRLPVSDAAAARLGDDDAARLTCAAAGDDYELLFAAPESAAPALFTLCEGAGVKLSTIGRTYAGEGLAVLGNGGARLTPGRLGYEHGAD